MLVVWALASAGTPASAAPAPTRPLGAVTPIAWHHCGDGFQCGTLTVPLGSRGRPTGSTLDLAVVRTRPGDPKLRIGSLVFNPGGPGAPAVAFLRSMAAALPAALRDRFDLVAFDPRGVGRSHPVECVEHARPALRPGVRADHEPSRAPRSSAQ